MFKTVKVGVFADGRVIRLSDERKKAELRKKIKSHQKVKQSASSVGDTARATEQDEIVRGLQKQIDDIDLDNSSRDGVRIASKRVLQFERPWAFVWGILFLVASAALVWYLYQRPGPLFNLRVNITRPSMPPASILLPSRPMPPAVVQVAPQPQPPPPATSPEVTRQSQVDVCVAKGYYEGCKACLVFLNEPYEGRCTQP